MSKEIDERVVSMQFDNALFEKNIQKSLKSVDDLNKSLNNLDGAKGFEELNKATKQVNFSPIIDSAKEVEKSFSKMEIVGTGALLRIGSELTEFGIKIGKNFWNATIGQIKSGGWKRASDIKAGKFMLEGLGLTDDQVQLMSKAASAAVTDTAAGLGEAMKAAGVLATSGLKDAQKMEDTLRGIAGMSAMTGRSFENIANIYSTVASNGKLMTMQLRQFSFAGINVAAKLAEQMGVTEEAVNQMVTKGQIDFQTFSDAMTAAFGDHAKDANKTFTGALANMKAALSRIGENFATPFMDNVKDVFNNLRVFFNAVNKALTPVYEDFSKLMKLGNDFIEKVFNKVITKDKKGNLDKYSSAIDNIVAGVRNLYLIIVSIAHAIGSAFKEVFPPLEDTSETFKNFTASLVPTQEGVKVLKVVFKSLFSVLKVVADIIGVVVNVGTKALTVIFTFVNRFVGLFGGIDELTSNFFEKLKETNILKKIFDGITLAILGVGSAIALVIISFGKLISKIKEFVSKLDLKSLGVHIIEGLFNGIKAGFDILKKVWIAIVNFIPDTLSKTLKIASPSKVMKSMGIFIMGGLLLGLISGKKDITEFMGGLGEVFGGLISSALTFADIIGSALVKAFGKLTDSVKSFNKTTSDENVKNIKNGINEINNTVKGSVHGYDGKTAYGMQQITVVQQAVKDEFTRNNKDMEESQTSLSDTISNTVPSIVDKLKDFVSGLDSTTIAIILLGSVLAGTIGTQLSVQGSALSKMAIIIGGIVASIYLFKKFDIGSILKNATDSIKTFFGGISDVVNANPAVSKINTFLEGLKETLKNVNFVALAGKAMAMSFSIAIIGLILNITKLASSLTSGLKKLISAIENLTNISIGFKETIADKLVKVALAIAVIGLTVVSIAKVAKGGGLSEALSAIYQLMSIFVVMSLTLALIEHRFPKQNKSMDQLSRTINAFALMCVALIGLSSILNVINVDEGMLFSMFLIGAIFVGFLEVLKRVKLAGDVNMNISLRTMLGLAAAIMALGTVITSIALALSTFKSVGSMIGASIAAAIMVGSLMSMMALLIDVMKDSKKFKGLELTEKTVPENVKILGSLTVFLLAMGTFMKVLSTIPLEGVGPMIGGTIMALLAMLGFVAILHHFRDTFMQMSDDISKLSGDMLKIAAAMYLLANIKMEQFQLALERVTDIVMTLEAITYAFGLLRAGLIALTKKIKGFETAADELEKEKREKDSVANTVWAFGFALASLAVALAGLGLIFALMPEDRLTKFAIWTSVLVTVLAVLSGVMAYINKTKADNGNTKNTIWGIVGVVGAIAGLLMSLIILSIIPAADLLAPIGAVAALLYMFSKILKELGRMNKYTQNAKTPLIALGIIMGALSAVMITLALIPDSWKGALIAAAGISAVLLAIGFVFKAIQGNRLLKIDPTVLVMTGILTIFIGLMGGLIYALSSLPNPDAAVNAAVGIGAMLLALALAVSIMSGKKLDISTLFALAIAAGVIIGLSVALTQLANVDSSKILAVAGSISIILASLTLFMFALGIIADTLPLTNVALAAFGAMFMQIGAAVLMAGIGISSVILSIAFAANLFAIAIGILETMDLDKVGDGLVSIAKGVILLGLAFAGSVIAISAAVSILTAVLGGLLKTFGPILMGIGAMIIAGLAIGMDKGENSLLKKVGNIISNFIQFVKDLFGIKSPSKVFKDIGDFLMKGLGLGIIQGIPFVGKTLEEGINKIINWMYEKSDEIAAAGDDMGAVIGSIFGDIANDKLEGFFGLDSDSSIIDTMLENAGISMDDLAGSADSAVPSLDDFADSMSNAAVSTDSMNNSMANAIDMFTEFNDQAYMTSKDVLPAFMSQIEGVAKWRDELASLSARGLGEVIVQELEQMGPQAYEKVHALYTMTNSELAMMNIMYKQKLALQNGSIKKIDKSFKKLGDTVNETMEESMDKMNDNMVNSMDSMAGNMMKALKKQMDYEKVINQVTGFRDNIADKIRNSMSIFEAVNEQEEIKAEELLKNMKDQVKHVGKWASMITEMAAKGFDEGLVATLTDMGPQSYSKVAAFLTMSEEQIAEANRLYEASEQVPEYGADKIVKAFAQAGFNASMGLTDSFLEGLDPEVVEQAMSDLGQRSITSLQDEIANNPYKIGELIPSDFAAGLEAAVESEKGRVKTAMQELADAANPENYLPEVGNEDLTADMIKAYGSKAVEDARKANAVNDETNRAIWAERDKNKYNQIYQEEQKKSYTQNKDYDFVYKTSSGGNKKLHDLLYAQYGESMYDFVEQIYDETGKLLNEYYDFGKLLSTGILQDNSADEALKKYLRVIVDNAQGNIDSMGYYDLGKNIAFTTSNGVEESAKYMSDAGDALMASELGGMAGDSRYATKKVKDIVRADIKSMPIGKGLIEFGAGIGDSTAEGINTEGVVAMEEAGQNLASSFIISLRDNLASLMDAILNSDDATSPKIKPVIDGSNMFDGIKSLLNKNPIDLSGSASIDVSTKNRDKTVVDAINGISNQEVVDAVKDLSAIVDLFRGQATSLQVVMDTGQTIGALGHPMDLYLGQQSKFAGRGN